jgi:hypothetical protein
MATRVGASAQVISLAAATRLAAGMVCATSHITRPAPPARELLTEGCRRAKWRPEFVIDGHRTSNRGASPGITPETEG